MNMKGYLFIKKTDDAKRYWFSVGTKNTEGEYISAAITVRISNEAKEALKGKWIETKTKNIRKVRVEITDSWLSAVEGKDNNFVVLFVNKCNVLETSKQEDEDF